MATKMTKKSSLFLFALAVCLLLVLCSGTSAQSIAPPDQTKVAQLTQLANPTTTPTRTMRPTRTPASTSAYPAPYPDTISHVSAQGIVDFSATNDYSILWFIGVFVLIWVIVACIALIVMRDSRRP